MWSTIQARHHTLLQTTITIHQGYVFKTIGDEINAAFGAALNALEAALDAQRALHTEDWEEIGTVHVHMGLHARSATLRADKYEGYLALSHAKRQMSTASGGRFSSPKQPEPCCPIHYYHSLIKNLKDFYPLFHRLLS